MANKQDKMARTYRLDRSVIALLETYAKENQISNTEVVELAIKRLCRTGNQPATSEDIANLRTELLAIAERNQIATLAAIQNQPIATLEVPQKKSLFKRLFS